MDAIVARALTVLKACITLQEPRVTAEGTVMEVLGIAINRYNGMTQSAVTMRPVSQADRNAMFFMCLDMVLSALNINVGNISEDYQQNQGTIAVLATPEIPYSVEAANEVTRLSTEAMTWGPDRQTEGPYTEVGLVVQHGRYHQAPNANVTCSYVDSRNMQVSLAAGAQRDIQRALLPQNVEAVMVYFVWRRFEIFSMPNGASQESPANMLLRVGGIEMRMGRVVAWNGRAAVTVVNNGQREGMIQIEVLWHSSLTKTLNQAPGFGAQLFSAYAYRNATWTALRTSILNRTTLPNIVPPIYPPSDKTEVMTIILLARLGDLFSVLNPNFTIHGAVAPAGPVDRAQALGAYR
ncbi:VP7 [Tilligerry virus]|uniref:Core protein VP7 n=1 Tax=Tilligerry virus TaxID=1170505 RepID=H9ZXQ8_9REOV|nr:VP7 [Tilligerry virus]